jgi:AraC-like DNA-binding protein
MISRSSHLEGLKFTRPETAPRFAGPAETELSLSGLPGWQSNGGPNRGHPARSFPFSLEARFPRCRVVRIHLVGIFAQYADPEQEAPGTTGASVQLFDAENLVFHHQLVNGLHYRDARDLSPQLRTSGDGSTVSTIGRVQVDDRPYRVDELTLDISVTEEVDEFKFKALSTPASFTVFDAYIETGAHHGCPFHSSGGGVPLARIGSIVRLGDRVEFSHAMSQLELGILSTSDLDEARGLALTFLAVLTAALLEIGGRKSLVLEQLNAARELEHAVSQSEVWSSVSSRIEVLVPNMISGAGAYSDRLMDRALTYIDRNFAKPISDASIADQLGLSTSHFRFLFKQATGQPFHKYLVAARLERAHRMLLDLESASVSAVAKSVGFVGLSHFSRAFAQRFNVSPASVRKGSAGHA